MKSWLIGLALGSALIGSSFLTRDAHMAQLEPERAHARQEALKVARQINMAQAAQLRFGRGYVPFGELTNVSPVPHGFRLFLVTDGTAYMFALKENPGPDQYAIVSDDSGVIYEAIAKRGGGVVPVGTF